MIKKLLLIVVAAAVAIVLAMAATQPDSFSVTRTATIKAPPEKIAALIGDFRNWVSWSPWEQLDPGMKRSFSGAASGTGAIYHWEGNSDVGAGRMEVTDMLAAPSRVRIKLDFQRPIESHNITEFALAPQGELTTVTWSMTGPMSLLTKVMSVFKSMDAMIGKDFEKGLAQLKAAAEK